MKKTLFIIATIILLLTAVVFVLLKQKSAQTPPNQKPTGTTFVSTSTDIVTVPNTPGSTTVPSQRVDAAKIIHTSGVVPDTYNPGYYFMGNTWTSTVNGGNLNYIIVFQSETNFFNVVLLKEPLKASREEAETYLKNMLQLSNAQMCALSYSLGTPQNVSDAYAGIDLKFSFCPNSVQLP
jgi:hypothetical protein